MCLVCFPQLIQELTASARTCSERWQCKKLYDLLILELNARDLIERLCRRKELHGLETFEWVCQLHSHCHPPGRKCVIQLFDTRFAYGYECKRSTEPMLLTPISERARMATVCALKLRQIPLLLGTSGGCCGRQVLLESLAHSVGVFLLTLECDTSSTPEDMMRMVRGVKMVGGWLLLRCFERLPSTIVTQIADNARETATAVRKSTTAKRKLSWEERSGRFRLFALTSSGSGRKMAPQELDRTLFRPVHITSVDSSRVLWLPGG